VIRPARPADYEVLRAIERRAGERFRTVGMPEIADDEPYSADEMAAAAVILVATEADEPIGYALVQIVDDHAHLEQLSVLPEHGGSGVGTTLLDAVATWARSRGDEVITLTTFRHVSFNAPFYARRGFVEVPASAWSPAIERLVTTEAAHGLDPEARVVMSRQLAVQ
jgi:GNAT superfamily N-acetyltransferase